MWENAELAECWIVGESEVERKGYMFSTPMKELWHPKSRFLDNDDWTRLRVEASIYCYVSKYCLPDMELGLSLWSCAPTCLVRVFHNLQMTSWPRQNRWDEVDIEAWRYIQRTSYYIYSKQINYHMNINLHMITIEFKPRELRSGECGMRRINVDITARKRSGECGMRRISCI